jgi:hypothetical protein
MGYLMDILIGVISGIATGELTAHAERIAGWVIDKAVGHLPSDWRGRFREEWLAHLKDTPGTLRKLGHAAGCYLGAVKLAEALLASERLSINEEAFAAAAIAWADEALLWNLALEPDSAVNAGKVIAFYEGTLKAIRDAPSPIEQAERIRESTARFQTMRDEWLGARLPVALQRLQQIGGASHVVKTKV